MSSDKEKEFNNWWLYKQLRALGNLKLPREYQPLIVFRHGNKDYAIYAPASDEYIITVDVVEKVRGLGGNTISYATTWCRASEEAVAHGASIGVEIIPHGALFGRLK